LPLIKLIKMIKNIEYNKLISNFKGFHVRKEKFLKLFTCYNWYEGDKRITHAGYIRERDCYRSLNYKSWDALKPVVEKIEKIGFQFDISRKSLINKKEHICIIWNDEHTINVCEIQNTISLIDVIYELVIEFIKWYNELHTN